MKRFVTAVTAASVICSCTLLDVEPHWGKARTLTEISSVPDVHEGGARRDNSILICCLEYPEGYDWQKDTAFTIVKGNISVIKNKARILNLALDGDNPPIGYADMNRIIAGRLFSDYSTSNETVILIDGKEQFRYSGREYICGIIRIGDEIFTLGQNRSGVGISYRKNGKLIFGDEAGIIPVNENTAAVPSGALYIYNGIISFGYYRKDGSAGRQLNIFSVTEGRPKEIRINDKLTEIYDIFFSQGEIYIAAGEGKSLGNMQILTENNITGIHGSTYRNVTSGYLLETDGSILLNVRSTGDKYFYSGVWDSSGKIMAEHKSRSSYPEIIVSGGKHYVLNKDRSYVRSVTVDGRITMIEGDYRIFSRNCIKVDRDRVYIGMTSMNPKLPSMIWTNGKPAKLTVNGYIIGLGFSDK